MKPHHIGGMVRSIVESNALLALVAFVAVGAILLRWEHAPTERVETAKFRTLDLKAAR